MIQYRFSNNNYSQYEFPYLRVLQQIFISFILFLFLQRLWYFEYAKGKYIHNPQKIKLIKHDYIKKNWNFLLYDFT